MFKLTVFIYNDKKEFQYAFVREVHSTLDAVCLARTITDILNGGYDYRKVIGEKQIIKDKKIAEENWHDMECSICADLPYFSYLGLFRHIGNESELSLSEDNYTELCYVDFISSDDALYLLDDIHGEEPDRVFMFREFRDSSKEYYIAYNDENSEFIRKGDLECIN